MPQSRVPQPLLTERAAVETPEHVVLEFELAGLGSRTAAALFDLFAVALILLVVVLTVGITAASFDVTAGWVLALAILIWFAALFGYHALFEAFSDGRTPGKRLVGIRVVMDTGHPITFGAAAARNLLRLVDSQPGASYLVGALFVFFHPQSRRLGDLVAGTIVVRDRPIEAGLAPAAAEALGSVVETGPPELADDEFRVLDQLVARLDDLEPDVRLRLVTRLADRFAPNFPRRDPNPETFLVQLHADERRKRSGRLAARQRAGPGRTTVAAERFVARKQADWEGFRLLAADAERRGLRRLGPDGIPAFAARYREVAADLARARTYAADPRVLAYLERVVSAGHNALYGLRAVRRLPLGRLLLRDLPAAVVEARWYVILAALVFFVPAVVGYTILRGNPAAAYEMLPDGIIARAESGRDEIAAGRGYAQAPSPFLPVMATSIIANNIQVACMAFAYGITAGLGTLVVLVFNGLFLGAIMGLFANYGLTGWILTFVAGHGVLELTAIFVAGGAGLVIGRALIAPGDLTRRDALVVRGRLAIRMVGAAAIILVLAGIIEGFHSASDVPDALKFAVSGASFVLLVLYFWNGRRALRPGATPAS